MTLLTDVFAMYLRFVYGGVVAMGGTLGTIYLASDWGRGAKIRLRRQILGGHG